MEKQSLPPGLQVLEITYSNFVIARGIYAFAKLGIADFMGNDPRSSEEIATDVSVDPKALYRLLRTLSTADVVWETSDHRFTLGPLGEVLRSDVPDSMRGWAIFSGEPFYLQAWEQIVHSIQTGNTAWEHVHQMPIFDYIGKHQDAAQILDQAMTSLSSGEAPAIVAAYDFTGIRTLADIGGGQGFILRAILKANHDLRGILVDRADALQGIEKQLEIDGLAERCQVIAGDFFKSVPHGAEVYLLKYVIHDWDDEQGIAILKNVRKAIGSSGKLLLVETIVPPPGEAHYAKLQDLEMMVIVGSKERTTEEYSQLLKKSGFKLNKVIPTSEPLSILEALPN
jgi:hypothetical protein